MNEWKYGNPVFLTKDEMLALSDLAGNLSLSEYMAGIIREHIRRREIEDAPRCLCPADGHSEVCPIHRVNSSPR